MSKKILKKQKIDVGKAKIFAKIGTNRHELPKIIKGYVNPWSDSPEITKDCIIDAKAEAIEYIKHNNVFHLKDDIYINKHIIDEFEIKTESEVETWEYVREYIFIFIIPLCFNQWRRTNGY